MRVKRRARLPARIMTDRVRRPVGRARPQVTESTARLGGMTVKRSAIVESRQSSVATRPRVRNVLHAAIEAHHPVNQPRRNVSASAGAAGRERQIARVERRAGELEIDD